MSAIGAGPSLARFSYFLKSIRSFRKGMTFRYAGSLWRRYSGITIGEAPGRGSSPYFPRNSVFMWEPSLNTEVVQAHLLVMHYLFE